MLPLIQREVVDRKGWIDEQEFLNMIALAQAAPGLIAVNSAIFIGWRVGGWKGVCGAVLGAVLPSFFIILAIAMVFQDWKELPAVEAAFKGIRPAVVALIAAPLFKMTKSVLCQRSGLPSHSDSRCPAHLARARQSCVGHSRYDSADARGSRREIEN